MEQNLSDRSLAPQDLHDASSFGFQSGSIGYSLSNGANREISTIIKRTDAQMGSRNFGKGLSAKDKADIRAQRGKLQPTDNNSEPVGSEHDLGAFYTACLSPFGYRYFNEKPSPPTVRTPSDSTRLSKAAQRKTSSASGSKVSPQNGVQSGVKTESKPSRRPTLLQKITNAFLSGAIVVSLVTGPDMPPVIPDPRTAVSSISPDQFSDHGVTRHETATKLVDNGFQETTKPINNIEKVETRFTNPERRVAESFLIIPPTNETTGSSHVFSSASSLQPSTEHSVNDNYASRRNGQYQNPITGEMQTFRHVNYEGIEMVEIVPALGQEVTLGQCNFAIAPTHSDTEHYIFDPNKGGRFVVMIEEDGKDVVLIDAQFGDIMNGSAYPVLKKYGLLASNTDKGVGEGGGFGFNLPIKAKNIRVMMEHPGWFDCNVNIGDEANTDKAEKLIEFINKTDRQLSKELDDINHKPWDKINYSQNVVESQSKDSEADISVENPSIFNAFTITVNESDLDKFLKGTYFEITYSEGDGTSVMFSKLFGFVGQTDRLNESERTFDGIKTQHFISHGVKQNDDGTYTVYLNYPFPINKGGKVSIHNTEEVNFSYSYGYDNVEDVDGYYKLGFSEHEIGNSNSLYPDPHILIAGSGLLYNQVVFLDYRLIDPNGPRELQWTMPPLEGETYITRISGSDVYVSTVSGAESLVPGGGFHFLRRELYPDGKTYGFTMSSQMPQGGVVWYTGGASQGTSDVIYGNDTYAHETAVMVLNPSLSVHNGDLLFISQPFAASFDPEIRGKYVTETAILDVYYYGDGSKIVTGEDLGPLKSLYEGIYNITQDPSLSSRLFSQLISSVSQDELMETIDNSGDFDESKVLDLVIQLSKEKVSSTIYDAIYKINQGDVYATYRYITEEESNYINFELLEARLGETELNKVKYYSEIEATYMLSNYLQFFSNISDLQYSYYKGLVRVYPEINDWYLNADSLSEPWIRLISAKGRVDDALLKDLEKYMIDGFAKSQDQETGLINTSEIEILNDSLILYLDFLYTDMAISIAKTDNKIFDAQLFESISTITRELSDIYHPHLLDCYRTWKQIFPKGTSKEYVDLVLSLDNPRDIYDMKIMMLFVDLLPVEQRATKFEQYIETLKNNPELFNPSYKNSFLDAYFEEDRQIKEFIEARVQKDNSLMLISLIDVYINADVGFNSESISGIFEIASNLDEEEKSKLFNLLDSYLTVFKKSETLIDNNNLKEYLIRVFNDSLVIYFNSKDFTIDGFEKHLENFSELSFNQKSIYFTYQNYLMQAKGDERVTKFLNGAFELFNNQPFLEFITQKDFDELLPVLESDIPIEQKDRYVDDLLSILNSASKQTDRYFYPYPTVFNLNQDDMPNAPELGTEQKVARVSAISSLLENFNHDGWYYVPRIDGGLDRLNAITVSKAAQEVSYWEELDQIFSNPETTINDIYFELDARAFYWSYDKSTLDEMLLDIRSIRNNLFHNGYPSTVVENLTRLPGMRVFRDDDYEEQIRLLDKISSGNFELTEDEFELLFLKYVSAHVMERATEDGIRAHKELFRLIIQNTIDVNVLADFLIFNKENIRSGYNNYAKDYIDNIETALNSDLTEAQRDSINRYIRGLSYSLANLGHSYYLSSGLDTVSLNDLEVWALNVPGFEELKDRDNTLYLYSIREYDQIKEEFKDEEIAKLKDRILKYFNDGDFSKFQYDMTKMQLEFVPGLFDIIDLRSNVDPSKLPEDFAPIIE